MGRWREGESEDGGLKREDGTRRATAILDHQSSIFIFGQILPVKLQINHLQILGFFEAGGVVGRVEDGFKFGEGAAGF